MPIDIQNKMDIEVTVKYTVRNFCTKEELGSKKIEDFFNEIFETMPIIDMYSQEYKVTDVRIIKNVL